MFFIYFKKHFVAPGGISTESSEVPAEIYSILFIQTNDDNDINQILWYPGVCCGTGYHQSESVGFFSPASDRGIGLFINSNSHVLRNIWWDYLQTLSLLEASEGSNRLRWLHSYFFDKRLIVLFEKYKHILEDFWELIVPLKRQTAYYDWSQNSVEHEKAERNEKIWARTFKYTQTTSALTGRCSRHWFESWWRYDGGGLS